MQKSIRPYRWNGQWVFDDPAVDLEREPFVEGADQMIDVATAHIPNADSGFLAVFSDDSFPDARIILDLVRRDRGGGIYRWAEHNMEGWLCQELLRYFSEPPSRLYIQVRAAE
jgi:hypothetical protein